MSVSNPNGFNGKAAHILLVEDDRGDQELTRRALRASKIRNECHMVADGEEALDYLRGAGRYGPDNAPRPDLVLLDLNLPRVSGQQVLQAIRDDESLKSLIVIVLTTSDRDHDIARAYSEGANSYIRKPTTIAGFLDTVETLERYWLRTVRLPTTVTR